MKKDINEEINKLLAIKDQVIAINNNMKNTSVKNDNIVLYLNILMMFYQKKYYIKI